MTKRLIKHHTHYQEIDGYDKTVWMNRSEHRLLHIRLRKEGKCNIPPKELAKISHQASTRDPLVKEKAKNYYEKYFQKNKTTLMKQTSEYRELNKEKINAQRRKRYAQRKKEGSLKDQAEYHKKWWEKNKEKKST